MFAHVKQAERQNMRGHISTLFQSHHQTKRSRGLSTRCSCNRLVASLWTDVVTLLLFHQAARQACCHQPGSNVLHAGDIRLVGTTCNKFEEVVNLVATCYMQAISDLSGQLVTIPIARSIRQARGLIFYRKDRTVEVNK